MLTYIYVTYNYDFRNITYNTDNRQHRDLQYSVERREQVFSGSHPDNTQGPPIQYSIDFQLNHSIE